MRYVKESFCLMPVQKGDKPALFRCGIRHINGVVDEEGTISFVPAPTVSHQRFNFFEFKDLSCVAHLHLIIATNPRDSN